MKNTDKKIHFKLSFWGFALIIAAILLIALALENTMGWFGHLPMFKIAVGALLLFIVIRSLIKKKLIGIFFPLAFMFMIFEEYIALAIGAPDKNIISNWLVLLAALLLTVGFKLLIRKNVIYKRSYFGGSAKYIDCTAFTEESFENNFGRMDIYFENTHAYKGDGRLIIENNFGSTFIHLPKNWNVKMNIENSFGSVKTPGYDPGLSKTVTVSGETNFGSIEALRDCEASRGPDYIEI